MIIQPGFWQQGLRVLLVSLALLGFSATTQAHTGLKTSSPADGAVVQAAPGQIELTFTAAVRLVRFGLKDHEDAIVELGFTPDTEARKTFVVPAAGLGNGMYHAEWAAIGEDGHTVTGTFAFTVDPDAAEEHAGHHGGGGAHAH